MYLMCGSPRLVSSGWVMWSARNHPTLIPTPVYKEVLGEKRSEAPLFSPNTSLYTSLNYRIISTRMGAGSGARARPTNQDKHH